MYIVVDSLLLILDLTFIFGLFNDGVVSMSPLLCVGFLRRLVNVINCYRERLLMV